MLIDARTRHSRKKITRATATTLKTCNSLMSNPEVQAFYDKLSMIAEELPEALFNPLNLVHWQRIKYRPTESENRIRIENRISLKKAADEKMRPRVKPIKRISQSVQLLRNDPPLNYREFYQQFLKSQSYKNRRSSQPESEQEQPLEIQEISTQNQGFRFKKQLKKYHNVTSFIQEKLHSKLSQEKAVKSSSYFYSSSKSHNFSKSPATKYNNPSRTFCGKNEVEQLKIDSIVKKWKPVSKIQRKFQSSQGNKSYRRRSSSNQVNKPVDLMMDTHRKGSQNSNSDSLREGNMEL